MRLTGQLEPVVKLSNNYTTLKRLTEHYNFKISAQIS